jgi:hypothetical protein
MEIAIFDKPFLDLGRILLTTQNRFFYPVLCRTGAQSKHPEQKYTNELKTYNVRCTANASDLNRKAGRCSHALTEAVMVAFDEKTLWFDYGIVAGIMVCFCIKLSLEHYL